MRFRRKSIVLLFWIFGGCASNTVEQMRPSTAGVRQLVLDDFNPERLFPIFGGPYGTYESFSNCVTQNGMGTLVINASRIEGGGVYHDGLGSALWDFTGYTGLVVRVRALPNNTAKTFGIKFQDSPGHKRMFFGFSFSNLNTTSLVTLTKPLGHPDFCDAGFNTEKVGSWDIHVDYSEPNNPTFGLEVDEIRIVGPPMR